MVETSLSEAFSWSTFQHRHTLWKGWQGLGRADIATPSQVIYSKAGLPKSV